MRPITFPKTGPTEWTNRETGVQITRYSRDGRTGYEVCHPVGTVYRGRRWPYVESLNQAREWASQCVEICRSEIADAYEAACREDAERMAWSQAYDLIHHADDVELQADCGVDVLRTPYTYASPEWDEVTCKVCLLSRSAA